MYRIHYDPKFGRFVIQVGCCFGLFWTTVRQVFAGGTDEAPVDVFKVRHYQTYELAQKFATESGLATLYVDRSTNKFRAHMGR